MLYIDSKSLAVYYVVKPPQYVQMNLELWVRWCNHRHVIGSSRSVRIALPSLPPYHSGPSNQALPVLHLGWRAPLQCVIWMCRAFFTVTAPVLCQRHCLLPMDWVVVLPCILFYSRHLHHPLLAGISVFLQSLFQAMFQSMFQFLSAECIYELCPYV